MIVLDGNFALGCGPGTDYPYIHLFQCTLERTDALTNEVLEPITFVLAQPTVRLLDLGTEQHFRCNHCERKLTDVASFYRSDKHFVKPQCFSVPFLLPLFTTVSLLARYHLLHTVHIYWNWLQEQFYNSSLYTLYILSV